MRVLVTGGAGFLGSHLCDRLIADGHHVTSLDDYSSGSEHNHRHLIDHPQFRALDADVREGLDFDDLDAIYHLACPASPADYERDPIGTATTAVIGTLQVLDLARATGARVLLASTSEVYGEPAVHPQPESYWGNVNLLGPRACYDEGKRMAEVLSFDYARTTEVEVKVARIFNTYGPRMPADGRVVRKFISLALAGEPLVIMGDGHQTRSFCYVADTVDALVLLMASESDFQGPVNLGNPEEITVLELAELVCDVTGSASPVDHIPERQDDPTRRCPDITLARKRLGWSPQVRLGDGLKRTVDALGESEQNRSE